MRKLASTLLFLAAAWPGLSLPPAAADEGVATELRGSGGRNAEAHLGKPRVVIVSLDGFRYDFPDRHDTPVLDDVARRGVRVEALIPPFPSLTFPSHYSIATGLNPGRHGIVANHFLDPATGRRFSLRDRRTTEDGAWYGGEPIWVTAESQGMVAAAFYFVGTEADVRGVRPSDWRPFDISVPGAVRVDQVLEWLAAPPATRPHVITLYLGAVDRAGHSYGPDSPEVAKAVAKVDALIGRLLQGIEPLQAGGPIHVVVVSDHGLMPYWRDAPRFVVDDVVDMRGVRTVVGGPVLYLHLEDPTRAVAIRNAVNTAWRHGRAWLPAETPARWGVANNPRFGHVILVADPGYAVVMDRLRNIELPAGSHGWAPEAQQMHGVFLAVGPGLPSGLRLPTARAIDVYPFLARLLDLTPPPDLDGSPARLADRILGPVPAGDDRAADRRPASP